MKSVLITGGAGFIGANFIDYFLKKYPNEYTLVNIDKLTYAGHLDHLNSVENNPNHIFVKGDICDKELIHSLFKKFIYVEIKK